MSRDSYSDVRNAGSKAQLIQFIPGESWDKRHKRRLDANLGHEEKARAWATENGFHLTIKNNGHHWTFMGPKFIAEWWPSSAKLVFSRQYKRGIHAHDWLQVTKEIERRSRAC